jgi:hypothetical protein
MDVSNIGLITQWKARCTLSTLWQRFGRGGRDLKKDAIAVFLVEREHFDHIRKSKAEKLQRRMAKRRKTTDAREETEQSEQSGDDESLEETDILESRRLAYSEAPAKKRKTSKSILEPAMDDFINAGSRGLKCHRTVLNIYFGNNTIGAFSFCDELSILTLYFIVENDTPCMPEDPRGCPRCTVRCPTLCCDLDSPAAFERFTVEAIKSTRAPARSRIKLDYIKTPNDNNLDDALEQWRLETMERVYGKGVNADLGPGLVLPDDILDRILDCTHYDKINSIEQLEKETRWVEAARFGEEILQIIRQHRPRQNLPLQPSTNMPNRSSAPSKSRRVITCSACGVVGHNRIPISFCFCFLIV